MNPELYLELNTIEDVRGKKFFKDASGKHHDAEINGHVGLVDDPTFGRCANVAANGEGWSNYLNVPWDASTPNDVVTVRAWVYVGESGCCLTFQWSLKHTVESINFLVPSPQSTLAKLQVVRTPRPEAPQCTIPLSPPIFNTWYHLAAVIEGSKCTLYLHDLKGNRIGQPGNGTVQSPGAHPYELRIYSNFSQLRMAHLRVYKGALTQEVIDQDIRADIERAIASVRASPPIGRRSGGRDVSESRIQLPGSAPVSKSHFASVNEGELELNRGAVIEVSVYVKREELTEADKKKLPPHGGHARRPALRLLRHQQYADKIEAVQKYYTEHGLSVTYADHARRLVKLSGTIEDMAKAFGETPDKKLALGVYTDTRRHDRTVHFISHTGPLHLPGELSGVVDAVLGLDNRPVALARANRHRGPDVTAAMKKVADLMPEPDIACWPSEVGFIYGFR